MNQHIRTIGILGAGAVGSYLVMALSGNSKKTSGSSQTANEKNVWRKTA